MQKDISASICIHQTPKPNLVLLDWEMKDYHETLIHCIRSIIDTLMESQPVEEVAPMDEFAWRDDALLDVSRNGMFCLNRPLNVPLLPIN